MNQHEFENAAEAIAVKLVGIADELRALSSGSRLAFAQSSEASRYVALARTAAQESELWLGKAVVTFASTQS